MDNYGRSTKMFLEYNVMFLCNIKCILNFIEDNSVFVGIVSSVLTASLWFSKNIKQKRAEAFFGFYARLSLYLRHLHTVLEEDDQLNVDDSEAGNIFSLIYMEDYTKSVCPKYKEPGKDKIELYQSITIGLQKVLLNTENNVYPQNAVQEKWYESQHIIFSFCEFINKESYRNKTNQEYDINASEPKHIVKCKLLINAMNYIQDAISNTKY